MAANKGRILVTLSTFCEEDDTPRRLLRDSGFEFVENPSGKRITPEQLLAMGTDWSGLVAGVEPYRPETLSLLPQLKCISRVGVGIDSIDLDYCRTRGIVVRNTPDAPTAAVAEMTLALLLDVLKRLSYHDGLMKQHKWSRRTGLMLAGKTVGIVGTGRIGRRTAELLAGLGVTLRGCDVNEDAAWAKTIGLTYCSLGELLSSCDIVCLHAAREAGSPPLVDAAAIGRMKRGAILVNTARGHVVDYEALTAALADGRLGGAGLDVYPKEPYDGPLCDMDNVVLTPHISTLTRETRIEMETLAIENLLEELRR
ncbi:MAG: phosphoglycerate dehydrogenase [Planctomycetes bacterium]|nr:phosphoglycerate dehydrogenase [Planctomycetota bacterium]